VLVRLEKNRNGYKHSQVNAEVAGGIVLPFLLIIGIIATGSSIATLAYGLREIYNHRNGEKTGNEAK